MFRGSPPPLWRTTPNPGACLLSFNPRSVDGFGRFSICPSLRLAAAAVAGRPGSRRAPLLVFCLNRSDTVALASVHPLGFEIASHSQLARFSQNRKPASTVRMSCVFP